MCVSRRHAARWVGLCLACRSSDAVQKDFIFTRAVPFEAVVPATFTVASNVCRGVSQRQWSRSASSSSCSSQISDASSSSRSSQNTAGTDASTSELAGSDACFSQSTDGSDVAMTDFEENVPSAGQGATGSVRSELLPVFQPQLTFPAWDAR